MKSKPRLLVVILFLIIISTTLANCTRSMSPAQTDAVRTNTPIIAPDPGTTTVTEPFPTPVVAVKPTVSPYTTATVVIPPQSWQVVKVVDGHEANRIRSLVIDASGHLWAGGPSGLVMWNLDTEEATVYTNANIQDGSNVVSLAKDKDGLWIGTFGGGIYKKAGLRWSTFSTQKGLPGNYVSSLTAAGDGKIWVSFSRNQKTEREGSYSGYIEGDSWHELKGGGFLRIVEGKDGKIYAVGILLLEKTVESVVVAFDTETNSWKEIYSIEEWVTAFSNAPDGSLWLATPDRVYRFDGNTWNRITPPWSQQGGTAIVSSIAASPDGAIWFGFSFTYWDFYDVDKCGPRSSQEIGVYRLKGDEWVHFTTEDGLVDNKICDITVVPDGDVWFGSFDKGISRFDGKEWKTYRLP